MTMPMLAIIDISSASFIEKMRSQGVAQEFDLNDLSSRRPSLSTRRLASLYLSRNLLFESVSYSLNTVKEITLKRKTSGAPYLCHSDPCSELLPHISISHSGSWVACVLSDPQHPVCIDIEDTGIKRAHFDISTFAFSEQEKEYVAKHGVTGFYRLWTAKEAILKLREVGLSDMFNLHIDKQLENPVAHNSFKIEACGSSYIIKQEMIEDRIFCSTASAL
jgi:4'-phosphopantetheinyl transferase